MMNFIHWVQNIDLAILSFIKNTMHSPFMDKAMVSISFVGNAAFIWIVIGVLLIINKKYRKIGFMVLMALILGSLLCDELIKHIVKRPRPCFNILEINLLISKPVSYSFPSGHTTSSFAAAGILSRYFRKYSLGIFSLAILIAFSRLYLYVHYPSDVLAGTILGLLCSNIIFYFSNFNFSNMSSNKYINH